MVGRFEVKGVSTAGGGIVHEVVGVRLVGWLAGWLRVAGAWCLVVGVHATALRLAGSRVAG